MEIRLPACLSKNVSRRGNYILVGEMLLVPMRIVDIASGKTVSDLNDTNIVCHLVGIGTVHFLINCCCDDVLGC